MQHVTGPFTQSMVNLVVLKQPSPTGNDPATGNWRDGGQLQPEISEGSESLVADTARRTDSVESVEIEDVESTSEGEPEQVQAGADHVGGAAAEGGLGKVPATKLKSVELETVEPLIRPWKKAAIAASASTFGGTAVGTVAGIAAGFATHQLALAAGFGILGGAVAGASLGLCLVVAVISKRL